MQSQTIEYTDGTTIFRGQLYLPKSGVEKCSGVLVFPEAFGLGEHAKQRAERLAAMGYVALAADLLGGGALYSDTRGIGPTMQMLFGDRLAWRKRARAALDLLAAQPQVDAKKMAAIGFCFGGATSLELARSGAPLAAIATFHGGLLPELADDAGKNRAKVLICHGAEDPLVKPEVIQAVMSEFRRDKTDWQFIYYGNAQHSFTEPAAAQRNIPGLAYDEQADRRSWLAMCNLFEETFSD